MLKHTHTESHYQLKDLREKIGQLEGKIRTLDHSMKQSKEKYATALEKMSGREVAANDHLQIVIKQMQQLTDENDNNLTQRDKTIKELEVNKKKNNSN